MSHGKVGAVASCGRNHANFSRSATTVPMKVSAGPLMPEAATASAMVATLPLTLVWLSTEPILLALGQRPELAALAQTYANPQVFSIEKGATPYTMQDIFDGRFCGACHSKVAFPSDDCQRCHTEPVM